MRTLAALSQNGRAGAALWRESIRESRDAARVVREALAARVLTLEVELPERARELLTEWESIEDSEVPERERRLARRVFVLTLLGALGRS
jgi:hypothetical protein